MKTRRSFSLLGACSLILTLGLAKATWGQAQATQNPPASGTERPSSYEGMKRFLMERYDGKLVVVMVPGLFAGEQQKNFLGGRGENGIYWVHFDGNIETPNKVWTAPLTYRKISDLNQLDPRTFGDLAKGLNVTALQQGEPLKVYKFYVYPDYVEFVLSTTKLEHLRDIDLSKATKEVTTSVSGQRVQQNVSVGGFGLVFRFYFNKGMLKEAYDYQHVIAEINKYVLPQTEAPAQGTSTKTVALDQTLEQVESILGKPEKIVDLGQKKIYVYKDMKVIFQDGKVADVQ